MGMFIQANGEVLILLRRMLRPERLKMLPESFLQSLASPGISCRRGARLWGRSSSSFCLFISLLILCNTSMTRDPADMHLSRWQCQALRESIGPGIHKLLEGQDCSLARASEAALQLLCCLLIV